jgi:hypothetical protein
MPVEGCGIGNDSEGLDGPLQESRERGEGGLTVLVLGKVVVGLKRLKPNSGLKLVVRVSVKKVVVQRVKISRRGVVGSDIGAGTGDL